MKIYFFKFPRGTLFVFLFIFLTQIAVSQLVIPDTMVLVNDVLTLPVRITGVDSLKIYSYQFDLYYDTNYIEISEIITGTGLNSVWKKPVVNYAKKGLVKAACAGAYLIPADGIIFYLSVITKTAGETHIQFKDVLFNEGNPEARFKDCKLLIVTQ